jgi:hypothetical protein
MAPTDAAVPMASAGASQAREPLPTEMDRECLNLSVRC